MKSNPYDFDEKARENLCFSGVEFVIGFTHKCYKIDEFGKYIQ